MRIPSLLAFTLLRITPALKPASRVSSEKREIVRKRFEMWGENRGDRKRSWSLSTANGEDMFSSRKSFIPVQTAARLCAVIVLACCVTWPVSNATAGKKTKSTAKSKSSAARRPAKARVEKKPTRATQRKATPRAAPRTSVRQAKRAPAKSVRAQTRPSRQTVQRPAKTPPKRESNAYRRVQPKPEPRKWAAFGEPERRPPPGRRLDRSPRPKPVEQKPLSRPERRYEQPKPRPEEREPLPHPRQRYGGPSRRDKFLSLNSTRILNYAACSQSSFPDRASDIRPA